MNPTTGNNKRIKAGLVLTTIGYLVLAFFTERENTTALYTSVAVLFGCYFYLLFKPHLAEHSFNLLLVAAFIFRGLFLFAVPALSDDYFRFIWDGRLAEAGINPFLYLPTEVQAQAILRGDMNAELYQQMNSPNYYSVYPPVLQFVFFIAAKLSFSSNYGALVILRIFILLAEVGSFYFLTKIIAFLALPKERIFIYLLNPLVIIEISGNLHFEGVMLFFVLGSLYFLFAKRFIFSAIFFSLAVFTKMIPLVLLPLIIKKTGLKQGFVYAVILLLTGVFLFLPFINQELIGNISNSVGLYFQKFEFNASVYYLLRWVGFQLTGYNEIAIIGKLLPALAFVAIMAISFRFKPLPREEPFFEHILAILFVYYLFALIIHPWYITFLVVTSVFVKQRFALVWSFLIFGTYLSYAYLPFKENTWVLLLEYSILMLWYFVERYKLKLA